MGELILPKMPEITGLYVSTTQEDVMYVTEKTCNGVLKVTLTGFKSEINNLDDFYKP